MSAPFCAPSATVSALLPMSSFDLCLLTICPAPNELDASLFSADIVDCARWTEVAGGATEAVRGRGDDVCESLWYVYTASNEPE